MFHSLRLAALPVLMCLSGLPAISATVFANRTAFQNASGVQLVDDYENPNYQFLQSDAAMSAVEGETAYRALTHTDVNIVFTLPSGSNAYCAGCNGDFALFFANTSVGDAAGVYGVGFDLVLNSGQDIFVTFGDGSQQIIDLPLASTSAAPIFWGITDARRINRLFVGIGGADIAIDNLTLASFPAEVPEPAAWPVLAVAGAAVVARRRRVPATSR
ncbi:MAG: PEP-CTERM sorting domain-containing protein [Bryobacterales bacterium]|nr:PEP-CTERM sorting domain-containing protein [Bryobacterales bacterium]